MPFAGYSSFDDCVSKNSDKDSPEAYCGSIKHRVEDKAVRKAELRKAIQLSSQVVKAGQNYPGTNVPVGGRNLPPLPQKPKGPFGHKAMDKTSYSSKPWKHGRRRSKSLDEAISLSEDVLNKFGPFGDKKPLGRPGFTQYTQPRPQQPHGVTLRPGGRPPGGSMGQTQQKPTAPKPAASGRPKPLEG